MSPLKARVRLFVMAVGFATAVLPLAAQGPAPVGLRRASVAESRSPATYRFIRDSLPRTHWALGAGIGVGIGVLGGIGLQGVNNSLCEGSGCRSMNPLMFMLPIMIFGIVGGLIGSAFPKS